MGLIRQIWPQFDFSADRDINGDGNMTENISTLSACFSLVVFRQPSRARRRENQARQIDSR